eukprot:705792-Amphidinium_carterae.1
MFAEAGDSASAVKYFEMMRDKHHLMPNLIVYTCMVQAGTKMSIPTRRQSHPMALRLNSFGLLQGSDG